jgi:hypothetical protein
MDKIWLFITSIISAAIAAFIAHKLTLQSKKHEILFQEKLKACKSLQQRLISLKKYCLSVIADYEGNEFAPRYEDDCKSALTHRQEISSVIEDNYMFFPMKSFPELSQLDAQLSLLCNFELLKASNWQGWNEEERSKADNSSGYEGVLKHVERCLNRLQHEINKGMFHKTI